MYRIIGADGREYGPVPPEQLRQWIAEGRANAETRVRIEGSMDWKPLAQFPEFSALFPAAAPISPPQYLIAPRGAIARRTNSAAMTGFIFGLLSITGGFCCFGYIFMILGLVFSIVGLSQINSNPELYEGKGIAIAGLVLSIVGLFLAIGIALLFSLGPMMGRFHHHVYRL
jgi:hypothetical protein